jgi:hypothetical protein
MLSKNCRKQGGNNGRVLLHNNNNMNTFTTEIIAASQKMAHATVVEFVAFAKTSGVEIPDSMVAEFFSQQGVKLTKTGKVSKASARKSKKSPGKRSAYFDFLAEEVEDGVSRRQNIAEALRSDDCMSIISDAQAQYEERDDEKSLQKIRDIETWLENNPPDADKKPPAQIVNKMGSLMWGIMSDEEKAVYKNGANTANVQLQDTVQDEAEAKADSDTDSASEISTEKLMAEITDIINTDVTGEDDESDEEMAPDDEDAPVCTKKRCNEPAASGSDMCEKHIAKAAKVNSRRKKRSSE